MSTLHTLLLATEPVRLALRPLLAAQPDVHVVAATSSLHDARDLLSVLHVDLVVFESSLPEDDSFEVLPAVPLRARAICLTRDMADALRALNYGSLECVPLPIVPRVLLARLAAVRHGVPISPFATFGVA